MKTLLAAFLFLSALTACAAPEGSEPTVTKELARKAIETFLAEPATDLGYKSGVLVLSYSKQSEDVQIVISGSTMPWMKDEGSEKIRILLTSAYMAGSVRSQWERGEAKDDALAGEEQVIATYRQLKKAEPELHVEAVEKFAEMKAQGMLAEYIKELQAADARAEAEAPKKKHPGLSH